MLKILGNLKNKNKLCNHELIKKFGLYKVNNLKIKIKCLQLKFYKNYTDFKCFMTDLTENKNLQKVC